MSDAAPGDALFPERFVPGEMHGLIEAEHLARYRWASALAPRRRVLDAGCGVGYGSLLLSAAGASSVTGVDISQDAIDRSSASGAGSAMFVLGDIGALPFEDDSFELAVCFETIEHVADQERALEELRRVLTPDGLLAISSPNRDVYQEGNPHHTREYTPEELFTGLGGRFANVRLERQQAWLASLVCNDVLLATEDAERVLDVEVRKVAATPPGRETFTLALAGDVELPALGALTVLTSADEMETWRERARSAEQHLEHSHHVGLEAASAYESISAAHEALREEYADLRAALDREHREHAEREQAMRAEHETAARTVAEQLREAHERTAELTRQREEADAALARIRESLAWRLSAPLRGLLRR
jgi:SAM-dependent methyltransferase